jgi:parallel beta-helix repeat protein
MHNIISVLAGFLNETSISWSPASSGACNLTAVADPLDEIAESNERNNLIYELLSVEAKVEGTGTFFEITGGEYLNITLTSSERVHVILESFPRMVSFIIESNSSASSTILTITGFEPDTTYYRYQDGYLMENLTTDASGGYTYTQDISEPHHVFIQEETLTLYISSDYTFTSDIYETIVVTADDIVIDGNGYTLQGPGTGWGFYLYGRSGVTIKNVTVKGWRYGIVFYPYSNYNSISGNNITNNWNGIALKHRSSSNSISGNNITANNWFGIYLVWSSNNIIYHNNIIDNGVQASDTNPAMNNWHHPDLLEGNYWSDYPGVDDGSGGRVAGDGIGDTHIPWPGPDYDYYPFVSESGWVAPPEDTAPPVTEISSTGTLGLEKASEKL